MMTAFVLVSVGNTWRFGWIDFVAVKNVSTDIIIFLSWVALPSISVDFRGYLLNLNVTRNVSRTLNPEYHRILFVVYHQRAFQREQQYSERVVSASTAAD